MAARQQAAGIQVLLRHANNLGLLVGSGPGIGSHEEAVATHLTPALPAFDRGQAIVFRPLLARQSPAAKIPFQMQDASRERGYVTLT